MCIIAFSLLTCIIKIFCIVSSLLSSLRGWGKLRLVYVCVGATTASGLFWARKKAGLEIAIFPDRNDFILSQNVMPQIDFDGIKMQNLFTPEVVLSVLAIDIEGHSALARAGHPPVSSQERQCSSALYSWREVARVVWEKYRPWCTFSR